MIASDRVLLDTCIKSIQDAPSEGGSVYKEFLSLSKFTEDIGKQIKEHEKKLADLSQSIDRLIVSVSSQERQVITLLDKIKNLMHDKDMIVGRLGELRGPIGLKMETTLNALNEAQDVMVVSDLADLPTVEMHTYLFSSHIFILENLKKSWDNNLSSLKTTFANVFKFV